jgi:hypothetical protein
MTSPLAKPRTKYETQESKHSSLFAKKVVMWCYYYYIKTYDPHNEVAYEKKISKRTSYLKLLFFSLIQKQVFQTIQVDYLVFD